MRLSLPTVVDASFNFKQPDLRFGKTHGQGKFENVMPHTNGMIRYANSHSVSIVNMGHIICKGKSWLLGIQPNHMKN